jgi:hypothetical protein
VVQEAIALGQRVATVRHRRGGRRSLDLRRTGDDDRLQTHRPRSRPYRPRGSASHCPGAGMPGHFRRWRPISRPPRLGHACTDEPTGYSRRPLRSERPQEGLRGLRDPL